MMDDDGHKACMYAVFFFAYEKEKCTPVNGKH